MSLKNYLLKQYEFEKKYINNDDPVTTQRENTIKFCLSLIKESTELLDEIDYKNIYWGTKEKEINRDKIEKEIIDIFIFCLDLFLVWNMDSKKIAQVFNEKMIKNMKRYGTNK